MDTQTNLIFRTWTETSHGFTTTHVWIATYYRESVAKTLAGAINNDAGYGTLEAAQGWVDACTRMAKAGVQEFWRSACVSDRARIKISCQHSKSTSDDGAQEYCGPSFEIGNSLREMTRSMDLLQELGRPIEAANHRRRLKEYASASRRQVCDDTFENPENVLAVLRRRKDAVEVEEIQVGPHAWNTMFVKKGTAQKDPRPAEYTLAGVSSPGMQVVG